MDTKRIFAGILTLLLAVHVSAFSSAHNFDGNVYDSQGNHIVGALIIAWISGTPRGNYTTQNFGTGYESYYNIDVQGDTAESDVATVTFTVGSHQAAESATFHASGNNDQFDLHINVTSSMNTSVTVNGGATYSNSSPVTLTLSAVNASQCRFKNDGGAWSPWTTYSASNQWNLSEGDGNKTVYAQCRDAVGATADPASDSILLDTLAPQALNVTIAGGAAYTNTTSVTLTLSATGATQCRYSNDGSSWSSWEAYATSKSWTLSSGDGMKTLYYQCQDDAGNAAAPVSDTIILDTQPPTGLSVSIAGGAAAVNSTSVILTLSATGASQCRYKNEAGSWSAWSAYATTKAWTLSSGDGAKTVYYQCKDEAGNEAPEVSDAIVLDTTAPSYLGVDGDTGIHITSGNYTNTTNITLILSAVDERGEAFDCRLSNDGSSWTAWVYMFPPSGVPPIPLNVSWNTTSGEGLKTVFFQCRDGVGNAAAPINDTVTLDTQAPTGLTLSINNGSAYANSTSVNLTLTAAGASECRFANDGGSWSAWEAYATSKAWTLASGDGVKTVWLSCRDLAGNEATPVNDTITLDTQAPSSLSIIINGGDAYTNTTSASLTLTATGASQCRLSNDATTWSSWEAYATSKAWTLSSGDGVKTVYYQCKDDAGNAVAPVTDSIILTTVPLTAPQPSIYLNADGSVTLNWSPVSTAESYTIYMIESCNTACADYPALAQNVTATSWTDTVASLSRERYYKVSAVRGQSVSAQSYAVGKFDVSLSAGWNLVSVPLTPTYSGIKPFSSSVFASLHNPADADFGPSFNGSYDFVVGPVNDGSAVLGSFNPKVHSFLDQNLRNITEKVSFQILMNQPDVLTVVGLVSTLSNVSLASADWYWIGYPSCMAGGIKPYQSSVLSSLHGGTATDFGPAFDGSYTLLIGAIAQTTVLGTFDPLKYSFLPQNLQNLVSGNGYIIHTTHVDALEVQYDGCVSTTTVSATTTTVPATTTTVTVTTTVPATTTTVSATTTTVPATTTTIAGATTTTTTVTATTTTVPSTTTVGGGTTTTLPRLVSQYKFDEGSGPVTRDSAAHNDAAVIGASWQTANCVSGKCLLFDGVNDYVDAGAPSDFNFERGDAITLMAWIKTTSEFEGSLIGKMDSNNHFRGYDLFYCGRTAPECPYTIKFHEINSWNSNALSAYVESGGATVNDGVWHHIAVTYDGSSTPAGVKIYVDGVSQPIHQEHSSLSATIQTPVSLRVGSREVDYQFDGLIDEVRIYRGTLSASEVLSVYNAEKP